MSWPAASRLAGLPLGRARHADLHVARQGTVDAELDAFADRFVREQAIDNLPYSHAMHSRACLRVHRGELEAGYQELLATGRRELEWGARNPAVTPWRSSAALVAARLGDTAAARRLAAEEVELARAFGAPRALGVALRAAGLVARRRGARRRLGRRSRCWPVAARARARAGARRPRAALRRARATRRGAHCRCGLAGAAAPPRDSPREPGRAGAGPAAAARSSTPTRAARVAHGGGRA